MSNDSFLTRALGFLFKAQKHKTSEEQGSKTDLDASSEHISRSTTRDKSENNATHNDGENQSSGATNTGNETKEQLFTPENVLKALGVEILENGGDGYYLVGFQGGAFVLFFDEDRLNIMYNDVAECSYSDSVKAAFIANEINSTYAVWSCYLRTSTRGTVGLPVKICFSQMFPLKGDFEETTEFIHGMMTSAFTVGREFRERFKKALKDTSNLANVLNQKDFVHKLELAKRMMEVHNFTEIKDEMPPASYLRIETLADLFNDSEFGRAVSLQLIIKDQCEVIDDPQEVIDFDIRSFIRNHPNREELQQLTLIVTFEKQSLIISLKRMPGSSPKSLFFALNVMRTGLEDDMINHNRSVISFRDTIEIRLTTEQEDYWEVKYMVEEAIDKHNTNDISSLNDEQKMMLIQLAPNVQDDLYWGFKFFNEDCLFQSLFYFKRIYYNYYLPGNHSRENQHVIADLSLYIGIVYYQLKRYELAYYYLDKTNKYESIIASEWYVNCLCSLNDPKAFGYIKRMIDIVTRNLENNADSDLHSDLFKFYLFLKRRLVQTLVSENQLIEAELLVKQMINNKENEDFCRKELDIIKQIRQAIEQKANEKRQHEQKEPTSTDTESAGNEGSDTAGNSQETDKPTNEQ